MNTATRQSQCPQTRLSLLRSVFLVLLLVFGLEQFFSKCDVKQRESVYLAIVILARSTIAFIFGAALFAVSESYWRSRHTRKFGTYLTRVIAASFAALFGCCWVAVGIGLAAKWIIGLLH